MIPPKTAQEMLDEINKCNYKLSGLDYGLVKSVKERIKNDKPITTGQAQWLDTIKHKAISSGLTKASV